MANAGGAGPIVLLLTILGAHLHLCACNYNYAVTSALLNEKDRKYLDVLYYSLVHTLHPRLKGHVSFLALTGPTGLHTLTAKGWTAIKVDPFTEVQAIAHLWSLTTYDRVLYIEPQVVALRDISSLFHMSGAVAAVKNSTVSIRMLSIRPNSSAVPSVMAAYTSPSEQQRTLYSVISQVFGHVQIIPEEFNVHPAAATAHGLSWLKASARTLYMSPLHSRVASSQLSSSSNEAKSYFLSTWRRYADELSKTGNCGFDSPCFFLQTKRHSRSIHALVGQVRSLYPWSYFKLLSDGGDDFTALAKHYSLDFEFSPDSFGYPAWLKRDGIPRCLAHLQRLVNSIRTCPSPWFVLLEDDVYMRRRYNECPPFHSNGFLDNNKRLNGTLQDFIKNRTGVMPTFADGFAFGLSGGSVFNTTAFLEFGDGMTIDLLEKLWSLDSRVCHTDVLYTTGTLVFNHTVGPWSSQICNNCGGPDCGADTRDCATKHWHKKLHNQALNVDELDAMALTSHPLHLNH